MVCSMSSNKVFLWLIRAQSRISKAMRNAAEEMSTGKVKSGFL